MTPEPQWEAYEYPYSNAPAEIRRALPQLLDPSRSADELELFLYSELLPFVLHQGDLYSGALPLVQALRHVIAAPEHAPGLELAIIGFLEYVFSRYVRDERSALVRPFRYGFCGPTVVALAGPTVDAFRAFKALFHEQVAGRLPPEDRQAEIYYRCVLGTCEQREAYLRRDARELVVDEGSLASLVIGSRLHAELWGGAGGLGPFATPSGLDPELRIMLDVYRDPARTLDDELYDVLKADVERPWRWGQGSFAVIGATGAVLRARHRSEAEQIATLERVLELHASLVRRHADDEIELEFASPQTLLEDVAALVYLEHLGRGQPVPVSRMSAAQVRFFELMSQHAKTHTHSMLHAGVLPAGIPAEEVDAIGDIHTCYG